MGKNNKYNKNYFSKNNFENKTKFSQENKKDRIPKFLKSIIATYCCENYICGEEYTELINHIKVWIKEFRGYGFHYMVKSNTFIHNANIQNKEILARVKYLDLFESICVAMTNEKLGIYDKNKTCQVNKLILNKINFNKLDNVNFEQKYPILFNNEDYYNLLSCAKTKLTNSILVTDKITNLLNKEDYNNCISYYLASINGDMSLFKETITTNCKKSLCKGLSYKLDLLIPNNNFDEQFEIYNILRLDINPLTMHCNKFINDGLGGVAKTIEEQRVVSFYQKDGAPVIDFTHLHINTMQSQIMRPDRIGSAEAVAVNTFGMSPEAVVFGIRHALNVDDHQVLVPFINDSIKNTILPKDYQKRRNNELSLVNMSLEYIYYQNLVQKNQINSFSYPKKIVNQEICANIIDKDKRKFVNKIINFAVIAENYRSSYADKLLFTTDYQYPFKYSEGDTIKKIEL